TAEWGIWQLCAGFGQLRLPLDINDPIGCANLLEMCFRSLNLRTRCIGISQNSMVYMHIWQEAENDDIWRALENVLFGKLRWHDQVAYFHHVVVE
ncbi:hypothetical protein C8Q73DRAFT_649112, partial [Cubamyces lactineus]